MAKATYFVPDSVAGEVHERTIDLCRIEGLPLGQQVAIIDAFDRFNIDGTDMFEETSYRSESYDEDGGTGSLSVETDARGHWYGIVFNPQDPTAARQKAWNLVEEWCGGDDEEEDEEDDDGDE